MAFLAFLKKANEYYCLYTQHKNLCLVLQILRVDINTWFKEQIQLAAVLCYHNLLHQTLSHKVNER